MATTKRAPARKRATSKPGAKQSTGRGAAATKGAPRKKSAGVKKRAPPKNSAPGNKSAPAKKRPTAKASGVKAPAGRAPLAEYNRKRDFTRTREPAGVVPKAKGKTLHFVVQKHDASHLHYDFRLELDGVMKSWAVPKGPSYDPAVRRLAMEVEDHPISYNTFEGTIPAGEYGGGTVMLWDRGTYDAEDGGGAESLRRGYHDGDLKVTMAGERLRGSWVLVRLKRPGRPQWLLIKHRDDTAYSGRDVTSEETTSVVTGRAMDDIAAGRGGKRVWRSNR